MCYSCPPQAADPQDLNRLEAFFRLQIALKLQSEGKYYNSRTLETEYGEVARRLERAGSDESSLRRRMVKCLVHFKKDLENLINDTFSVYSVLTKYRIYLRSQNTLQPDETDLSSMKYAVILAKTVARVFQERFAAFLKTPDLNLSNSNFDNAFLVRSNISGSNFINSSFYMAQLDNSVMTNCDFSICNFNKANAVEAKLDNCTFNYSSMVGINLKNASMKNSLFDSVIFRDPRTDTNIEYARKLVNVLEGRTSSERLSELIEARRRILDALKDKNYNSDFVRDKIAWLHGMLNRNSPDKRLWNLNIVGNDDDSVHLCVQDEYGDVPDYKKTVFDQLFNEISAAVSEINAACSGKVISGELLDLLIEAESLENMSDRENRINDSGELCLEKAVLSGAVITGSSLHQMDFSHINISNAYFEKSDLSECSAFYTNAEMTSFANATISDSMLYCSRFVDSSFENSNCINTCFIDCQMESVNMQQATAIGVKIINTERKTPFIQSLLQAIPSRGIENNRITLLTENIDDEEDFADEKNTMIDSNWIGAKASKAVILSIMMDRSHFTNADIRNAMLVNDVIRWSDFDNVDASYSSMLGNSYHQSSFNQMNFSQSHSFACEFSGCQMLGTVFIGARCDKVIFYDSDLSNSNFSHCLFKNCIFRGCNFSKINLSNTDFINCVFSDVDFSSCTSMNNAVFTDCIFIGLDVQMSDSFDDDDDVNYIVLKQTPGGNDICVSYSRKDSTGRFELYGNDR